ncbi:hypothetical protein [Agromyces sp. Soil535]|uniref:hypothetical protein n=1 Tax=Agromyces sp. Soil535 TaxID=1736390 RepID=UPI0006F7DC2F|nr:hypothetical protein [Agromyces sp. Soil535]KRE21762.1 hypothetical protein ASG80_11720 [Agromyces sp. Soil535]
MPLPAALRTWAFATGYLGLASALALALFFGLADPFGVELRTWFWLGPASDVLSVALAPTQIVAAILLWRALAPSATLAALAVVMSLATAYMAVTTVRMLMGVATLDDQYVAAIPAIVLMFGFLLAVGLVGSRRDRMSRRLARWAVVIGAAGVAAMLAFAIGFALPAGSAGQWTVFVIGGIPAAIAYVAYPVWWLVLGSGRAPR